MSAASDRIDDGAPPQDVDRIQRQISHRAKRLTVTAGVLARWRRHRGRWRPRFNRASWAEHAHRLAFERRAELEAMMEAETRVASGVSGVTTSC
ncbi:hypothetical protein HW571_19840 [Agrobacterium genomosp. 3]|uniref:hypothetical protein n=1 Tax=Agrobacterium TaxID=357 RepID=UPI001CD848FD|nr:hypothetical protein [Agrobacterium pusense]MCA1867933.1 hypothetical protein [Agrobacterium tomkonis]MCA1878374.1 hypothetical protein [Agrobacterium tumefaciens]MCA1893508.1 hypothetical protein [Agrobacterium tomkonis]MDH0118062.1 hypothetical protein [Agrobacterium pusense]MDH0874045.1 hypothetical protein [Agrobacterium pusense]